MKNDLEQISNEKGDASTQRHRGDRCDSATADSGRPADRTFNGKVEPYSRFEGGRAHAIPFTRAVVMSGAR